MTNNPYQELTAQVDRLYRIAEERIAALTAQQLPAGLTKDDYSRLMTYATAKREQYGDSSLRLLAESIGRLLGTYHAERAAHQQTQAEVTQLREVCITFRAWLDHAHRAIGGEHAGIVIAKVDELKFPSPFDKPLARLRAEEEEQA